MRLPIMMMTRMDLATQHPTSICAAAWAESAAFYETTAAILWDNVRARAFESANPKRTTTYPFTISFVDIWGEHMGDIEFKYEAPWEVGDLRYDMESGNIEGFPELLCQWHRYRLLYDGKQLDDDGILDYIVAADNPTVTVRVTVEPPREPCECPRCMHPRAAG